MPDTNRKVGAILRLLASGGWADQDPDVVAELLNQAKKLAEGIVADGNVSPTLRSSAEDFLRELQADTL